MVSDIKLISHHINNIMLYMSATILQPYDIMLDSLKNIWAPCISFYCMITINAMNLFLKLSIMFLKFSSVSWYCFVDVSDWKQGMSLAHYVIISHCLNVCVLSENRVPTMYPSNLKTAAWQYCDITTYSPKHEFFLLKLKHMSLLYTSGKVYMNNLQASSHIHGRYIPAPFPIQKLWIRQNPNSMPTL